MQSSGGHQYGVAHKFPSVCTVWRILNMIMAVFFILAAAANLNDPDWYVWIPLYAVPGLLCIAAMVSPSSSDNPAWRMVSLAHLIACIVYGVYQIYLFKQALDGRIKNPLTHEEGRESAGLFIIIAWLAICRFTTFGRGDGLSSKTMMAVIVVLIIVLTILPLFMWGVCFIGDWHTKLGHCSGMFKKALPVREL